MTTETDKTRAKIIKRLHEHGDFPAMAETVLRVNRLAADDEAPASELAQAILDDYALTNKVLRVVNSAIYGRSHEVTTISRAIVVLGWNSIRSLVLTFKLFDSLPDTTSKQEVKTLMGESFCTGMVARNVAVCLDEVREEQAFICGLFHDFGQLLVHFYLPEASQQILQLMSKRNKSLMGAARLVLGMTFSELGVSVAQELRFPKLLTACMQNRPRIRISGRPTPQERLIGLTALSGRVKTALLAETKPPKTQANVATLFKEFERLYGPVGANPETVVTRTLKFMEDHASILGLPIRSRQLVEQISESFFVKVPKNLTSDINHTKSLVVSGSPEAIINEGIEEVGRPGPRSLNDVLLVVLETMFRGLSFAPVAHAVFLIRDPAEPKLRFRCGLGEGLESAQAWFTVPLEQKDIFSIAVSQRKDLVIEDISAVGITTAYPPVFRKHARAHGYAVLLPIVLKEKTIGVFFLQGKEACRFEEKHLGLLKRLRDVVIDRIRQASLLAA